MTASGCAARGWRRGAVALVLAIVAIVVPVAAQAATNLLPNPDFEGIGSGSLSGWSGQSASLALANDGRNGGFAAKVTSSGSTPTIKSAKIVVPAGTYIADGFARTDATGQTVCLRITEFSGTTNVGNTQLCATLQTTGWTALPTVTRAITGTGVSVMVLQKNSTAGQTFEVDDMSLVAQGTGSETVPAPPTNLAANATSSTAIQVSWTASAGATSYNVYRDLVGTAIATVTTTSFTDTGLTPSTTYQYQVSAVNTAGESAKAGPVSATTQAAGGVTGPQIAVAGDISCDPISGATCRNRAMQTSDLIVGQGYDAVLTLGDNQYDCGGYSAFLQNYDLTWGRVKSITHPIPGEDDWLTTGGTDCPSVPGDGYFDYFNGVGAPTGPAGNRGEGYYSWNLGSWHLVALNSVCTTVPCTSTSAQVQWLQADLAADTAQCTLIYSHNPHFSSAGAATTGSRTSQFWSAAINDGAELMLNGNAHAYERFAPQTAAGTASPTGLREIIAGTGGKSLATFKTVAANSEVRVRSFGVLELTLGSGAYSWRFRTTAGTVADSGTDTCH
jgi:hypothetical protein